MLEFKTAGTGFGIDDLNQYFSSRNSENIVRLLKPIDPTSKSRKHARYLFYWASANIPALNKGQAEISKSGLYTLEKPSLKVSDKGFNSGAVN